MQTIHKKIPAPLSYCKQLFDRNVLEIKKLVKDSGNLTPLIHKEQQKNYMMTAILLLTHSLLSLMKKIQCYGFISLEYNHDNEKLINSKNRLSFKIKHNIKKDL